MTAPRGLARPEAASTCGEVSGAPASARGSPPDGRSAASGRLERDHRPLNWDFVAQIGNVGGMGFSQVTTWGG